MSHPSSLIRSRKQAGAGWSAETLKTLNDNQPTCIKRGHNNVKVTRNEQLHSVLHRHHTHSLGFVTYFHSFTKNNDNEIYSFICLFLTLPNSSSFVSFCLRVCVCVCVCMISCIKHDKLVDATSPVVMEDIVKANPSSVLGLCTKTLPTQSCLPPQIKLEKNPVSLNEYGNVLKQISEFRNNVPYHVYNCPI